MKPGLFVRPTGAELKRAALLSLLTTLVCLAWPLGALAQEAAQSGSAINIDLGTGSGLTQRVVRGRHVMRNALLPVITAVGLQVGALLAGAVLTETVFNFGGIGEALKIAFSERDYPVLQLLVFVAALTYVLVNLLVDILYAVVDPRVRTR